MKQRRFGKNVAPALLYSEPILLRDCLATTWGSRFSVRSFGCAPFLFGDRGGYMSRNIPEKVFDITGVELTPGEPAVCLGNGEQGFECCCDECEYYLLCFPEFVPKSKENIATGKI